MKQITLLTLLISSLTIGLNAQIVEIEGKAKITDMDPATASAQPIAREPDGTLSQMTASTTYAVGDFAQGGVVFWVSTDRKHGKVVNIYDVGPIPWSDVWSTSIGASARSDINGAGNTVAIILQDGHKISAAEHCNRLAYGGYDDWYLPSRNELKTVYTNRAAINTTSTANGGEIFASTLYWSSTEDGSDDAWLQNFVDGNPYVSNKNVNFRVRAVRAF